MKQTMQSLSLRDIGFSILNMLWVTILYKLTLYCFISDFDPYNPFIGFIVFFEFISLALFMGVSTFLYYIRYNRIVFFNAKFQLLYIILGSQSFLLITNLKSEVFILFLVVFSVVLPSVISILTDSLYRLSRKYNAKKTPPMIFNIREVAKPLWQLYLKSMSVAPAFVLIIASIMIFSPYSGITGVTETQTNEQFIKYIISRSVDYALFITIPLWVITYFLAVFRINTVVIRSLSTQIATIIILTISFIVASLMFESSTKAFAIYGPPTLFLLLQGIICKVTNSGKREDGRLY